MITDPTVEAYLYELLPPSAPLLTEMEQEARQRHIPIVGPAVARVFRLLAQTARAKRIFELGSAIGYSTLWWAEAVGEGGEVYFTDSSAANCSEAAVYFRRAGLDHRIHVLEGEALQLLAQTHGSFDLIFLDLNKPQYPDAYRAALPRLNRGGLLVADNVLREGKAAHFSEDPGTLAIQEFNRMIYSDPQLDPVILPLRDGLAVCRKL